jgi:hypothetical protein
MSVKSVLVIGGTGAQGVPIVEGAYLHLRSLLGLRKG